MQYRSVNGDPVASPAEEFDLLDDGRPRGGGFVPIGDIARPIVARLAQHLADTGVIEASKIEGV